MPCCCGRCRSAIPIASRGLKIRAGAACRRVRRGSTPSMRGASRTGASRRWPRISRSSTSDGGAVGGSGNFFEVLGVPLALGRNFTGDECRFNGPHVAILSDAFWRRRFAGDPTVVGRALTLNDEPTTIVGVLPSAFDFDAIFSPGNEIDLITPFPLTAETARWGNTLFGIGRLKPGITVQQAEADLRVVSDRFKQTINYGGTLGARVSPLNDALRGSFRQPFYVLAGAVVCVLAIACVNLSNLLLARINARRQEFAVRVALGARTRHLVQQALAESLLLAFAGSVIGVPVAVWATRALAGLQTFGVPLLQNASIDPLALAVTIALTGLAGIACGVLPAFHLSRGEGAQQQATHQRSAGRASVSARNTLVVVEVALACMLLVGAGLLFRSFTALLRVDLGFQPQHAMAWRVDPPRQFKNAAEGNQYLDGVVRSVAAIPGVDAVGLSDVLPLGRNRTWGVRAKGVLYRPGEGASVYPRIVEQHYLQAMQIPLRGGRYFDERDKATGPKSVIINENLARALWPDRDAVGQSITQDGGRVVVGVVGNVRHGSLEEAGRNEMYLDYRQTDDWSGMEMVVRSSRPPESLARDVRAALATYDSSLPSGDFYELERLIDNAVAPRRLTTRLLGFFSALALTLAALGLYGLIAYSVVQRTQEIGIRMAIGAQRRDVLALIIAGGLRLVVVGVALGLTGAFILSRVLGTLLFGVTAHDPLVFAGNAALLVAIAAAACLVPALRATRVNPIIALRAE
ncbi:MAG: multidrug ABC transporter substrate-binding protein [Acidobacteria bacterium]|nr:MAG: multidrug ABC transporter substrate-binding protein [Acidobacteriota bacterium]